MFYSLKHFVWLFIRRIKCLSVYHLLMYIKYQSIYIGSMLELRNVWYNTNPVKKQQLYFSFDFYRFCVVIRVFHPRQNSQWPSTSKDFLNSWERASAKQGNYWYHFYFITSLVLRGPWLGIEPGTSCTRSQHYTTRR